jgi:hypothetical protein
VNQSKSTLFVKEEKVLPLQGFEAWTVQPKYPMINREKNIKTKSVVLTVLFWEDPIVLEY